MGTEVTQVLQGRFRTNDGPTVFLKMETEGDKKKLGALEVCSSISPHGQKRHRSFVEDGLVLAVIGRCALVDRLGVGGGRIQPV